MVDSDGGEETAKSSVCKRRSEASSSSNRNLDRPGGIKRRRSEQAEHTNRSQQVTHGNTVEEQAARLASPTAPPPLPHRHHSHYQRQPNPPHPSTQATSASSEAEILHTSAVALTQIQNAMIHHHPFASTNSTSTTASSVIPSSPAETSIDAICSSTTLLHLLQITIAIQQMAVQQLLQPTRQERSLQESQRASVSLQSATSSTTERFPITAALAASLRAAPHPVYLPQSSFAPRVPQSSLNLSGASSRTRTAALTRHQKVGSEEKMISMKDPKKIKKKTIQGLTGYAPRPLATEKDKLHLSPYQVLLREQINLFENATVDVSGKKSQGRSAPLLLGQVGISCRHCSGTAAVTAAVVRDVATTSPQGSILFTKTLAGVYQISQNMSTNHFLNGCSKIPKETARQLQTLRERMNRGSPGGKQFWIEALEQVGVVETGDCLRFAID